MQWGSASHSQRRQEKTGQTTSQAAKTTPKKHPMKPMQPRTLQAASDQPRHTQRKEHTFTLSKMTRGPLTPEMVA